MFERRTDIDNRHTGAKVAHEYYTQWGEHLDEINARAPASLGLGLMQVSSLFSRTETEREAVSGTLQSFVLSIGIAFGATLLFIGNVPIAVLCTVTIVLIVLTLMGFMLVVLQWPFGAIEAISVTIFVGFSVDYQLHLAHSYAESKCKTRYGKTREALALTGISVVSAALTTLGAATFLFFCRIRVFQNFGARDVGSLVGGIFLRAPPYTHTRACGQTQHSSDPCCPLTAE